MTSARKLDAGSLSLIPQKASLSTTRIILVNEKKWIAIHANVSRRRPLAVLISKTVTTMLRHDQEERQTDGSRFWDSIKSVLVRKFAHEGARDFDDEAWVQMIFEGSTKKRIEYCKNGDGIWCYLRALRYWWDSSQAEINGFCTYLSQVEKVRIS